MNRTDIHKMIEQGLGQPKCLTLNLAIPLIDDEKGLQGTQFGIWDAPNGTDTIQVRFNENSAPQIPFRRGKVLIVPFERVFITVQALPALTGNMEILYGFGETPIFRILPGMGEVGSDIVSELQGDLVPEGYGQVVVGAGAAVQIIAANVNRRGFDVQAHITNAGNIYVGYDNTVAANNCVAALVAGQGFFRDDYRGDVYAIASVAGQLVNYGEV